MEGDPYRSSSSSSSQTLPQDDADDAIFFLKTFVLDFLEKSGFGSTADAFAREAGVRPQGLPVQSERGFLRDWWALFWKVHTARLQQFRMQPDLRTAPNLAFDTQSVRPSNPATEIPKKPTPRTPGMHLSAMTDLLSPSGASIPPSPLYTPASTTNKKRTIFEATSSDKPPTPSNSNKKMKSDVNGRSTKEKGERDDKATTDKDGGDMQTQTQTQTQSQLKQGPGRSPMNRTKSSEMSHTPVDESISPSSSPAAVGAVGTAGGGVVTPTRRREKEREKGKDKEKEKEPKFNLNATSTDTTPPSDTTVAAGAASTSSTS
eukprot:GILJ01005240.1.p1 GENE.GILJ01005240.1~~GILJ01005240.1.p1  ORF type:complete len:318 (-),score=66.86 GILJ01005240.1:350-1303(-)